MKPFVGEFPLRLEVLANGSQGHFHKRAKQRTAENEIAWWELRDKGLPKWRAENAGPLLVTLTRLAPMELDHGNLCYALKGVQDVVAALLNLRSDRDGDGAKWTFAQGKTGWLKRAGKRYGDYRVRVTVTREGQDQEEGTE